MVLEKTASADELWGRRAEGLGTGVWGPWWRGVARKQIPGYTEGSCFGGTSTKNKKVGEGVGVESVPVQFTPAV